MQRDFHYEKNKHKDSNSGGAIGISQGLIFGPLLDNFALGLLLGVAFGGLTISKNG